MYIYSCLTCKKTFHSARGKWNPPKYCCHDCYSLTLNCERSIQHLREVRKKIVHKKRPDYICLTCCKIFYSANKKNNPKYCTRKCFQQRVKTDETIAKMSKAKKGKSPWNLGVNMWEGKIHPRGTLGMKGLNKGRKASEETIQKLRNSHYGIKYPERSGENHHFWRGGITPENMKIRKSSEYANWRRKVFERDNHTCVSCHKRGGTLNADHIMPFSTHRDLRFEVSNGRTLCDDCHRKTDTYGAKMHKNPRISKNIEVEA